MKSYMYVSCVRASVCLLGTGVLSVDFDAR
jgi:hypothetical protein